MSFKQTVKDLGIASKVSKWACGEDGLLSHIKIDSGDIIKNRTIQNIENAANVSKQEMKGLLSKEAFETLMEKAPGKDVAQEVIDAYRIRQQNLGKEIGDMSEDAVKKLTEAKSNYANQMEKLGKVKAMDKSGFSKEVFQEYTGREFSGVRDSIGGYFSGDYKKQRIGVAAGAYAAGAVGVRLLDGGTLTRNSNGERDIAGIPLF